MRWLVLTLAMFVPFRAAAQEKTLPGTKPLSWEEEDLSGRLMDAAHAFVERKIGDAANKRKQFWKYDLASREAAGRPEWIGIDNGGENGA